jgi:ferredoxin-NADP reductase
MDIPLNPPHEVSLTYLGKREEYSEVRTFMFTSDEPLIYPAGSYAHVRLFGMPEGEKAVREFSFASAPTDEEIWFGIDNASHSPYQERLLSLQPKEKIGLFKIKSHMTWPPKEATEAVFIAGGIGITPFRAMLRDKAKRELPLVTTLLHVGRESFLYQEEMQSLTNYSMIARADVSNTLIACAKAHQGAHFYVAGSPAFCESIVEQLRAQNILTIESDAFKGLTEEV